MASSNGPLVFNSKDLQRLPSLSQIRFIECAANTAGDHAGKPGADPQRRHGLVSCSEWTGILLKTSLAEDGRTRPLHLYGPVCELPRWRGQGVGDYPAQGTLKSNNPVLTVGS
jgi:hypothetical protein